MFQELENLVHDQVPASFCVLQELENFVYDQLPALSQLGGIEEEFVTFYVYGAVRKFFFALDPSRRGRRITCMEIFDRIDADV